MSIVLTDHTFEVVLISYIIFLNIFWYAIKAVLGGAGFPVSLIWHWRDLGFLHALVKRETNPKRRARFRLLLISFYVALVMLPVLILFFDVVVPRATQTI